MRRRRSGLKDTSPDAELAHLELFRQAGDTRRLQLCLALSDEVLDLAWQAIRDSEPGASEDVLRTKFVAIHYGQDLADHFSQSMARRHR
jgi:hypothetical protein